MHPGTPRGEGNGSNPSNKRLKISGAGSAGLSGGVPAASSGLGGRPGTPGVKSEASRSGTPSGHSGTRKTGRKKPPAKRVLDEDGEDDDDDDDDDDDGDGEADDQRLYCFCHQVSYGSMVGCDDKDCPHEWFHWGCVGLTEEPKGKWYCPSCAKRHGGGGGR